MKKVLNIGKLVLVLVLGVALARFIIFRESVNTVPVRKVTLEKRKVLRTVSASGEVKAQNQADLSFLLSGNLLSLNFEKDDLVQKGDLIASLSNQEAYYNLESAERSVDVAKKDRDLFIENYSTNRKAVGGSDEYEIQLEKLNKLVEKAKSSYKSAQESYYKNFLYAPFSGMVLDTYIEEGEVVNPGAPVVRLATSDKLIFEITVDQEDFGEIKQGQEVEIELDAYDNKTFRGRVSKLPNYANGGVNPSFVLELIIEDPENKVLLGMTGDAKIIINSTDDMVNSLFYDEIFYDPENRPYVWAVNNTGNLKKTYVETGLEGDLYTEIITPVEDTIVIPLNENTKIEEGFKANITNE